MRSLPPATGGEIPVRIEKLDVLRPRDYVLYVLLTVLQLGAFAGFLFFWSALPFDGITLLLTLLVFYLATPPLLSWFLLPLMRQPRPVPPRPGLRVAVVTSFVPSAESLDMLEETLDALVALKYPHDTWVLDEGDAEPVRELCRRLGALHFSRKGMDGYQAPSGPFASGTKHGNYNAWLHEVGFGDYDILVAFDPDHVPEPDFLLQVLGYFEDPGVGYVQAPQLYSNAGASFIARGAAEESAAFYSITQPASYAWDYPIINGSHNVHRMAALQEVGGLAAHDADDLLITLHYRARGWRGVYVRRILARGLTPVDWAGYLSQQFRWARSLLDVKIRCYPRFAGSLSRREQLLGLLHGLVYLRPIWIGGAVGLLAYMLASGRVPEAISYRSALQVAGLLTVFGAAGLFRRRFLLDPSQRSILPWRSVLLGVAKWPYFVLALLEVLLGRKRAYSITPKLEGHTRQNVLAPAHLPAMLVLSTAWLIGLASGHTLHPLLHAAAGAYLVVSCALLWTESWRYAPSYVPAWRPPPAEASSVACSRHTSEPLVDSLPK